MRAILADVKKRDERDSGRGAAPLKAADDAVVLDTTDLDIEGAFRRGFGGGGGAAKIARRSCQLIAPAPHPALSPQAGRGKATGLA